MRSFKISSGQKQEFINISRQVQEILQESLLREGFLLIYVPHTTAAITVNESADPSVEQDILKDLRRLVPPSQDYYEHFEGNSHAHTLSSLVGSSVSVIVHDGQLQLGRWQGIFLCEFDGPRSRQVHVSWVGE